MKKDKEQLPEMLAGVATAQSVEAAYSSERDLANEFLGRVQATQAVAQLTQAMTLTQLAQIKESKAYRGLAGRRHPQTGEPLRGTWDEFCDCIGQSRRSVDDNLQSLDAFGQKALAAMQTMGIGVRQLRQYRQLPADDRSALAQAAEHEDKDAVLDLAEQLVARHAREKAALERERDEARADGAAKDRLIAQKSGEINRLQLEAQRIKMLPADETSAEIRAQADAVCMDIQQRIGVDLNAALTAVRNHALEHDLDVHEWLAGQLNQINNTFLDLAGALGVAITRTSTEPVWADPNYQAPVTPMPDWMREQLDEAAAAEAAPDTDATEH